MIGQANARTPDLRSVPIRRSRHMTLRLLPLALAAVLPSAVGAQDFVFKCTDARGRVM